MKKMTMQAPRASLQRSLLSLAVATATMGLAANAHAVAFEFADGEITGNFDTTLTYGALWRVTGPNANLVGAGNGGVRNSSNFDNGNNNYRRGEKVFSTFRMLNDLDVRYKNFGGFFRVTSFYDNEVRDKEFPSFRGNERVIKDRLGNDYEILDAYVYGNFKLLDRDLNVRVGKQAINLGESTFIPNGLNVLNPVDVQRLRTPGAELREALLPTQMLSISYNLTDSLSLDLINKFQFRETRLEPNGSFFSTNDFLSPGADRLLLLSENATDQDQGLGTFLNRAQNRDAKHSGQYAVVLRYLSEELNNTEFGLYHINAHATAPNFGGVVGSPLPTYFAIYPENIATSGLSFNTLLPNGLALQGEYSYRKNQPLSLVANSALNAFVRKNAPGPIQSLNNGLGSQPFVDGQEVNGFRQVSMHQVQATATHLATGLLGADQIVTVIEAGYTHLNLPNGVDFGGPGVDFVTSTLFGAQNDLGDPRTNVDGKGLITSNSYGYRVAIRAPYNSVIGSVNLIPRIAYQHDVRGTSPTFVQGTQAATVGLTADYQNSLTFDLSYTNFFAGETIGEGVSTSAGQPNRNVRSTNQQLGDRDFIAATVSYAF